MLIPLPLSHRKMMSATTTAPVRSCRGLAPGKDSAVAIYLDQMFAWIIQKAIQRDFTIEANARPFLAPLNSADGNTTQGDTIKERWTVEIIRHDNPKRVHKSVVFFWSSQAFRGRAPSLPSCHSCIRRIATGRKSPARQRAYHYLEERTYDLNVLDLHVLALSPPNCSIPLKHFLFGFQSQRRTERASPEGVG